MHGTHKINLHVRSVYIYRVDYVLYYKPKIDTNCDHQRAVQLWTNSFDTNCMACPCDSYESLINGECDYPCRRPNILGFYSSPVIQKTVYYMKTTDKAPYCNL